VVLPFDLLFLGKISQTGMNRVNRIFNFFMGKTALLPMPMLLILPEIFPLDQGFDAMARLWSEPRIQGISTLQENCMNNFTNGYSLLAVLGITIMLSTCISVLIKNGKKQTSESKN